MFSLTIPEVFPAWSCTTCFQQQSFHMMWFGDTSAWEHRDVTARLRTLMKRTLFYPFNVSLCSQTLTCLVHSFQSLKLKQGKPTQGVFYFSLWDDLTFSPAAAADTVQGTVAWKKESVWLREKQAHILIWNICFLLSFYQKETEIFSLLASPAARAEGTPWHSAQ